VAAPPGENAREQLYIMFSNDLAACLVTEINEKITLRACEHAHSQL
jgi:hypothetical protein